MSISSKPKPSGCQVAAQVATPALNFLFLGLFKFSSRNISWSFGRCVGALGCTSAPSCTTPSRLGSSRYFTATSLTSLPFLSLFTFIFPYYRPLLHTSYFPSLVAYFDPEKKNTST